MFTPLRQSQQPTLELLLIPVQVAARFPSHRRWIEDGLQRFLQAVSIERRSGRKGALQFLDEYLAPLVTAEESAAVLDLPVNVVRRDLRVAQAWLQRELNQGPDETSSRTKAAAG